MSHHYLDPHSCFFCWTHLFSITSTLKTLGHIQLKHSELELLGVGTLTPCFLNIYTLTYKNLTQDT